MAYRVLIAQFKHETNTFSKLPTTLDDYRRRFLVEGEAIVPKFKGTKNEVGGYIDFDRQIRLGAGLWRGGQHHAVGNADQGDVGDDPRHHRRRGQEGGQARRHLPLAARRDGDGDGRRRRGRAARGAAQDRRARRADRGDARPACQCHDEDGAQRQCAGELSHLSAYRRLRAFGSGGRAAARRRWRARRSRAACWSSRRCWKAPITAAPPSPARCATCWPRPMPTRRSRASTSSRSRRASPGRTSPTPVPRSR